MVSPHECGNHPQEGRALLPLQAPPIHTDTGGAVRFRSRDASARRVPGAGPWALLAALAHLPLAGCSVVYNYDDPDGPRYEGHYSTTGDRSAQSFNLVTFNIQFAARVSTALDEIGETPALSEAGVLLLQEMDDAGSDAIAQRFGFDYVYYPGSKHDGKDFGNAVLSRWPIVDDHKLILPHRNPSNGRIRIAVAASLDTPEGLVHVYSVHTETPWLGPRARLEQAEAIADDAARFSEPLAIAGDFNTLEAASVDATVEIFTDRGYRWATKSVTDTVDSPVGAFTLDHVFTKGYDLLSAHTQATDASDHQPLWVVLARPLGP